MYATRSRVGFWARKMFGKESVAAALTPVAAVLMNVLRLVAIGVLLSSCARVVARSGGSISWP
jgi:hypothetical protein